MTKFDRICDIGAGLRQVTAQPGVRNRGVSEAAASHGSFYAPDPSSRVICSIGGEMLEICIVVRGTITGQHGTGIEKLNQMCVQFCKPALKAFHAIKWAFGPAGILNVDNGIPTLKRCAEWSGMHVHEGKMPFQEIARY